MGLGSGELEAGSLGSDVVLGCAWLSAAVEGGADGVPPALATDGEFTIEGASALELGNG
jgi:hypothetical protein